MTVIFFLFLYYVTELVATDSYGLVGSLMHSSRRPVSGRCQALVIAGVMSDYKAKQSLLPVATSCSSIMHWAARDHVDTICYIVIRIMFSNTK